MHVIAAKAVAFGEALEDGFKDYQQRVVDNAQALAARLTQKGLRIVGEVTDNHLVLVDVKSIGLTGKVAEEALDSVGITCNKNTIPFDDESPFVTSGIRLGTPAMTTRGFTTEDMVEVGDLIAEVLNNVKEEKDSSYIKDKVLALTSKYPLYQD